MKERIKENEGGKIKTVNRQEQRQRIEWNKRKEHEVRVRRNGKQRDKRSQLK